MLERFIILSIIVLLLFFILKIFKKKETRKINLNLLASEGLQLDNRPSLIYFWSDRCTPCVFQSKIFFRLKDIYRDVNFISLNAAEKKEVASGFSVKTVPAIVLISSANEMKFLNQGFTGEEVLKTELEKID
jgi:thiol-disulfide isomerase/thioredoxin